MYIFDVLITLACKIRCFLEPLVSVKGGVGGGEGGGSTAQILSPSGHRLPPPSPPAAYKCTLLIFAFVLTKVISSNIKCKWGSSRLRNELYGNRFTIKNSSHRLSPIATQLSDLSSNSVQKNSHGAILSDPNLEWVSEREERHLSSWKPYFGIGTTELFAQFQQITLRSK